VSNWRPGEDEGGGWGVSDVAKMLIRVDAELTDELAGAFPHLTARLHRASTTLTGDIADQHELEQLLHALDALGVDVVGLRTIPED